MRAEHTKYAKICIIRKFPAIRYIVISLCAALPRRGMLIAYLFDDLMKVHSRSPSQELKFSSWTLGERMKLYQLIESNLPTWIWSSQLKWHYPHDFEDDPLSTNRPERLWNRLNHCTHAQDVESSQHNDTYWFWRGVV